MAAAAEHGHDGQDGSLDAVAQRLQRKRQLLDAARDAIVARDLDGHWTYWNKAAERLYGWTADEVLGLHARTIYGPHPETYDDITEVLESLGHWSGRRTHYDRWGRPIPVEVDLTQVRDRDGRPESIIAVVRDLRDRLAIESRLDLALDAAAMCVWSFDVPGNRFDLSVQHERIFGATADGEELTGEWFVSRVVPADRLMVWMAHETSNTTGTLEYECRVVHADGSTRAIAVRGKVEYSPEGLPARLDGVMTDITHRHELEAERESLREALAQSQRLEAIGQLAGGVAHDFNNLLTVILGSAELLHTELAAQPALAHLAEMVQSAALRGSDLTQRLLAFGRKQMLSPAIVDPGETVDRFLPLLRRSLRENIDIRVVHVDETFVLVDERQLETAMMNLCLNASDAMPNGGTLTIALGLEPDGQRVHISVSDTGTGMSPDVRERAFEPFFTTKSVDKGSGLGLSMVHGFIHQSGGTVSIESTVGAGTSVRVLLPAASLPVEAQASSAPGAPLGGSETVLVVEDDELVLRHAVALLRSLGYRVLMARSGAEALAVHDGHPDIDLMFTDVVMPGGMDGWQLAERLRQARPDLPVVFTSGYAAGIGDVLSQTELLPKPYRRDTLGHAVRRSLASRGPVRGG